MTTQQIEVSRDYNITYSTQHNKARSEDRERTYNTNDLLRYRNKKDTDIQIFRTLGINKIERFLRACVKKCNGAKDINSLKTLTNIETTLATHTNKTTTSKNQFKNISI